MPFDIPFSHLLRIKQPEESSRAGLQIAQLPSQDLERVAELVADTQAQVEEQAPEQAQVEEQAADKPEQREQVLELLAVAIAEAVPVVAIAGQQQAQEREHTQVPQGQGHIREQRGPEHTQAVEELAEQNPGSQAQQLESGMHP